MAHVQAKPPSMHGNPQKKVSSLLHLHFHLPMTGEVGSPFLLAWVKKQETPALAITKDCNALSSTHVQAKPPSMHGNPKVSAYFTCIFHLPMTGEVGSPFLLAWVKKARDPSSRHHHHQGLHYPPLTYRRSHHPCMAIPQKSFYSFKIYRWTAN